MFPTPKVPARATDSARREDFLVPLDKSAREEKKRLGERIFATCIIGAIIIDEINKDAGAMIVPRKLERKSRITVAPK